MAPLVKQIFYFWFEMALNPVQIINQMRDDMNHIFSFLLILFPPSGYTLPNKIRF